VTKVFTEYASLYADRNGGYTQIFKMGPRRGDGAEIAVIKMVDYVKPVATEDKKSEKAE
jgi:large subunit ribosomal protein L17